MKKIILILIALAIIVLVVVGFRKKDNTESSAVHQASVQLSWIPSASFAGDVVGLSKFDEEHNLELSAEFGGVGINPIQMVQSGQHTFGYLGADEVLAANDKGADFVILAVITQNSPAGFVSLAEKNITTPKDLEGKKVGILPFGNATLVYENMLEKNGVDRKKIEEIIISPDLKPLLSGAYDVQPVFVYEFVYDGVDNIDLDEENGKYNVLRPEDFGVDMKGPVYFTKRETLEKNPEMVKAFVETMADGWNYAVKNPDEAIALLKDFAPEINAERERQVLEKGIPYFTAYNNEPLNSDTESWEATVDALKQGKVIQNDVDLSRVLQFQFINEYYK